MLSKRLEKLVGTIPHTNVLADVGCDHGYVGIEALIMGIAQSVVFVDISDACLAKARENCPEAFIEKASFVCQDGLGKIACDCAVICGMGGLEILSILQGAETLPNALVLQPMRNVIDLRKWVAERYKIIYDEIILDGKFYNIIAAEKTESHSELNQLELIFGATNIRDPKEDFILYLQNEQNKLARILRACNDKEVSARLQIVEDALQQIRRKL